MKKKHRDIGCQAEAEPRDRATPPGKGTRGAGRLLAALLCLAGTTAVPLAASEILLDVALAFDGRSHVETTADAGDLGVTGAAAKSVEAWVHARAFRLHGGVFSLGHRSGGEDFSLITRGEPGQWRVVLWGGDIDFTYPSENRWIHVALVYTGSHVIVYADGDEVVRAARTLDTSAAEPFRIGRWWDRPDGVFTGMITEVRVWNRALDRDEIQARMGTRLAGEEAGLAGYWPLDDGTGDRARDRVAGKNGRFSGEPRWVLARPFTADLAGSMTIAPGDTATLGPVTLRAPGGEVRYQWFFNGRPVDGATADTLVIAKATADDVGVYHVSVDDAHPLTPVASTRLRIEDWPVWRTPLKGRAASPGEAVTLGPVELHDPHGDVTYQWFRDGEPLAGATASSLTIDAVAAEHFALYHVVVDDALDVRPVVSEQVRLVEPDWPMWRFDAARSARSPIELADTLHLQWVRELPEPMRAWPFQMDDREKLDFDVSYAPVVLGHRIFVPSNVTDSVTAYDIGTGTELWRFYADGPVRLAPAAHNGRVYFVSDDGLLYSVDAASGTLHWTFRGGPSDHRLLGNERIINLWAARGGPVIHDGVLYFAAGIWPLHGVFLYAIDAESGRVLWVNDTTSSDYVALPHGGAYGYGGLAPQGYLAVAGDELVVAGGRTPPAFFNRETGAFLRAQFRPPGRPFWEGDYAVHAGGAGMQRNPMLQERVAALADQIDGEVFYQLAARDRLFVTTVDGTLYCFGPEPRVPHRHALNPVPLAPRTDGFARVAETLARSGPGVDQGGYALVLGAGSGDLMRELLSRSGLHVVVVENDAAVVRELRDELTGAGLHGRRAAVIEADPATFAVQPYLFSLVVSEDAVAAGIGADPQVLAFHLERLRPYGGLAWLGIPAEDAAAYAEAARHAGVDQVRLAAPGAALIARRGGPLTGAGDWTHQYQDGANSLFSHDERVRLPLGVLWFGGPNNHDVLPRHAGGPRPQVAGGRQVYLGVETLGARCVYTGRQLWSREFPGIGHPFTLLGAETPWSEGVKVYMAGPHGVTYIGSPFVTLPDSVYLRYEGRIHRLDPATGETLTVFALPGLSAAELYDDAQAPEWGHLSVRGDVLVATSEPHVFERQGLGWVESYSGSSSRRIAVLDRFSGEVLWEREARIGFRHNAIVSGDDTLFVVDGLSELALQHLARRGEAPEDALALLALDLRTGRERWQTREEVFGMYLVYNQKHDILIEGGNNDYRTRPPDDEPIDRMTARRGADGAILWSRRGNFTLPGAVAGDRLIPGHPDQVARLILTGEDLQRLHAAGEGGNWSFSRDYGCGTFNASTHLLLYRTGYAGFYDLEHESGSGSFGGFRSGCTSNLIAADGVLNALDYTRTCTCSYAHQTSLALVHMPGDPHIEFWTHYAGARPDPLGHGINFGAPGGRVDAAGQGLVWHPRDGTLRRHASAIEDAGGSPGWVLASARVMDGGAPLRVEDLTPGPYTVRFHFAELECGVEPGARVFDVLVNGEQVLRGVDIAAKAGGPLRGVVETVTVEADGHLAIEFRQADGSALAPLINGLEIIAAR